MSTKNIGIAVMFAALVAAAATLEINGKQSAGLWLLVALLVVFADWETMTGTTQNSENTVSVLDAWEAIGHDTGMNPSKEELLDSLRYMAQLAVMNDGGNPAWNAVVRERVRQVQKEGASLEHDDTHDHGELGAAAICYLEEAYAQVYDQRRGVQRSSTITGLLPELWPWHEGDWKPANGSARNLEKGLALGLAELERIYRAKQDTEVAHG